MSYQRLPHSKKNRISKRVTKRRNTSNRKQSVRKTAGASTIVRDLTERKRAEEEIKKLARFSSENPFPVLRLSEDGTVLYANEASEVLLKEWGCSVGGCAPTSWLELVTQALRSKSRRTIDIKFGEQTYSFVVAPLFDADYVNIYGIDITDRKRAEMVLRESEEQYRRIVETTAEGIWVVDEEGKTTYINPAMAAMMGYTVDELKGHSPLEFVAREEVPKAVELTRRREKGIAEKTEVEMRRKNGTTMWAYSTSMSLQNDKGEVCGRLSLVTDVTERRRAEANLKQSLEWQEAIFEGSRDAEFIADTHDRFVAVNGAACNLTGYTREELLKMQIPDLHEKEDRAAYNQFRDRIMAGEPILSEARICRKDGTKVDAEFSNSRVIVGGSPYMHTIARDISERKRVEEALRASEERYRRLFEGDLAGAYFSTPSGKLISCNAAFARIFRFKSVDDALATDTHELYSNPEARQLFLKSVRQKRRLELQESWLKRRDGTDMHVIENVRGVFDDQGELIEIQGYLLDDTERKRAEELMRQSKEQMAQLNKHLTEVRENERASVARELHDQLGQSLIALKIDLKWTCENIDNKAAATQKLNDMLGMLSSTIRDVQRISAELRPSILDDLGLASAIDWYGEEFAKRTGIKCDMDLEEVQSQNPRTNLALYRVLQEALTNVVRHAQATNVAVKLWRSKDDVCLEIVDDGIGIDRENASSIHSLGLLGMAERIAQFSGRIDISSPTNKGTSVRVSVPLND